MLRILGYGLLAILLVGLILVFMAWRAPEPPKQADALASLPAAQREALTNLCAQAGIAVSDLRLVFDSSGKLFTHEVNRRAIVIEQGQLTALSLQNANTLHHVDVSVWPQLRALDLRHTGLRQWESLKGLAHLTRLTYLNLSHTGLGNPPAHVLPSSLQEVFLAHTALTQIDGLLALSLQELDASHTPLQQLPAQLPKQGDWKLKLEGTPVTQPAAYSATWPFEPWVSSTPRKGDVAQGDIGQGRLLIQGQLQPVEKAIAIPLPRTTDANLADVEMDISIDTGKARIWLEEPAYLFGSPWFTEGKVEGFGLLRKRGYVFAQVQPGASVKLQGRLRLTTESRYYDRAPEHRNDTNRLPDWIHYLFFVEPLDGATVTGLRYRVRHVGAVSLQTTAQSQ